MSGCIKRARFWLVGLASVGLIGFIAISAARARLVTKDFPLAEVSKGTKPQEPAPAPDLEIHEWGTFLGMSASDGTALDGMYHEEHALPPFVHSRSRDQLRLPFSLTKSETPVIYFYTDRPQSVRLGVGFPKGIWTHWYPQATWVKPMLSERATEPERRRNGRICWNVDIIPARIVERARESGAGAPSPPAASGDALWNFSREVDAAYVKTADITRDPARPEYERFLFYRGLGESRLPLRMTARDGGSLTLDPDPTVVDGVRHVFVLRVEHGRAAYRYIPKVEPGQTLPGVIPDLKDARPVEEFASYVADDLAGRLEESGLFAKEARAMVNTWNNSYFQADGVRVLFVLPQRWTNASIPMTVTPPPRRVVRVMVGRMELLTPERERLAEDAIRGLASPDESLRLQAFATLRAQGRYVEPIVRRVLRTTRDPQVQSLGKRLLALEEITALRSAVNNAADGKLLNEDPLMLRAMLARVLRQVGLDREARSESVAILNILDRKDKARGTSPEPKELRAAALEAAALDASAAPLYQECIRNWSTNVSGQLSREAVTWCREWWIGRAYARCLARAGELHGTEDRLRIELLLLISPDAQPIARLNRVLLAYLLEAQGRQSEADALWSELSQPPESGLKIAARPGC